MDKKLTDSEIVQALEKHYKNIEEGYSNNLAFGGKRDFEHEYYIDLISGVISLINRQQAENDSLYETLDFRFNKILELEDNLKTAKAEAYKEFAERLKNEIISDTAYGCDTNQHTGYYDYQIKIGDIPEYIDNLLKEIIGE